MGGEGVEPSAFRLTLMATGLQAAVRNTTREIHPRVARVGVEPTESPGLSLAALPVCVPCRPRTPAPPAGFEPATSSVTEWRALQAAPRRRDPMAQEGFEPSASLVLSESGLPLPTEPKLASMTQYPGWESNPQAPGFKPGRSAVGVPGPSRGGSRGTRTHKRPRAATCFQDRPLIRPDGFREA